MSLGNEQQKKERSQHAVESRKREGEGGRERERERGRERQLSFGYVQRTERLLRLFSTRTTVSHQRGRGEPNRTEPTALPSLPRNDTRTTETNLLRAP